MTETLAPCFSMKKCPPGIAHGADTTEVQFAGSTCFKERPVHAEIGADGEIHSTGIAMEDYSRMQTRTKSQSGERRIPTPEWATNDEMLREVIVTYLEARLYSKKYRKTIKGTLLQRMKAVEKENRHRRPKHIEVMNKLCHELVAEKRSPSPNLERIRQLQIEIQGLNTLLRCESPAAMVAGVVYFYYRAALDSVGVAAELGLKPAHIRQMLWRLNRVGKELFRAKLCAVCGNEITGRRRDAEVCSSEECKLKRHRGYTQKYFASLSPEKLEVHRESSREWLRRKRAELKGLPYEPPRD